MFRGCYQGISVWQGQGKHFRQGEIADLMGTRATNTKPGSRPSKSHYGGSHGNW
jgi:hypothetical protein